MGKLHTSEPFVPPDRVAEFLAVSSRTVRRMVQARLFPVYRPLGPTGPARFRLSEVEKSIRRN